MIEINPMTGKKIKELKKIVCGLLLLLLGIGCSKSNFLDANPNQKLTIPKSLNDFRLLLENSPIMNGFGIGLVPALGEVSSDNYYLNENLFASDLSSNPLYLQMYTWKDNIFIDPNFKPEDWGFPYRCISYANIVLEGLSKLTPSELQKEEYNELFGAALFFRAHMYFQLMQIFAPMYDKNTAGEQYGVPLRLDPDIGIRYGRAKSKEVYDQVLRDLSIAVDLLPERQVYNTRPSKEAALGLLARVYLIMQEYELALQNAAKCLEINDELLDYNLISKDEFFPFSRSNKEIIFYSLLTINYMEPLNLYYSRVDSLLYRSYDENDLRKSLFYADAATNLGLIDDNGYFFRGSYDGSDMLFGGIATDEIYFIRAECFARMGNISAAMSDLNTILRKRWNSNVVYENFVASDITQALDIILQERRKELIMRGTRWSDLRRLNKEGANITPKRKIGNEFVELSVNSLHYTLLIPMDVINLNPGMPQNPR